MEGKPDRNFSGLTTLSKMGKVEKGRILRKSGFDDEDAVMLDDRRQSTFTKPLGCFGDYYMIHKAREISILWPIYVQGAIRQSLGLSNEVVDANARERIEAFRERIRTEPAENPFTSRTIPELLQICNETSFHTEKRNAIDTGIAACI